MTGAPRRRPAVVELVGPAGAGKSTLVRRLRERTDRVRGPLGLWGLPRLRLAAHGIRLAPTFVRLAWDPQPPAAAELAQLIRLDTLLEVVEAEREKSHRFIVLDEGPVFALSWMEVFYPDRNGPRFAAWRRSAIARWAHTLDAVVMLDAPDPVLSSRLRTRRKPHLVKHAPDAETRAFMARFRAAFGHVLADLKAHGGPPVVPLVSGDEPSDRAAARVLPALEWATRG